MKTIILILLALSASAFAETKRLEIVSYYDNPKFCLGQPFENALFATNTLVRIKSRNVIYGFSIEKKEEVWYVECKNGLIQSVQIIRSLNSPFTREDVILRAKYFMPKSAVLNENWIVAEDGDEFLIDKSNSYAALKIFEHKVRNIIYIFTQNND